MPKSVGYQLTYKLVYWKIVSHKPVTKDERHEHMHCQLSRQITSCRHNHQLKDFFVFYSVMTYITWEPSEVY